MKKLILKMALAASPLLAFILFMVFVFDPYNCVHYKTNVAEFTRDTGFTRNERVIKMRHVLDRETPYDALLFGSSRGTIIYANRFFTEGEIYNMSYSSGKLQEHFENIVVLDKKGRLPKKLYIVVDSDALIARTSNEGFLKNYPVSGFLPEIYFSYATEINIEMIKKCIGYYTGNYEKAAIIEGDYATAATTDTSGNYVALYADERIESDPMAHASREIFQREPIIGYEDVDWSQAKEHIDKINSICKKNGTELTLIIIPNYISYYLSVDPCALIEFVNYASSICEVYSFCGINEITSDPYNWYEASHFRPHIGNMLAQRVFRGQDIECDDKWFGVHVTAENVEEYTEHLYAQLLPYGIKKEN